MPGALTLLLALGLPDLAWAQTQTSSGADEVRVEAPFELPKTPDPSANVHHVPQARLQRARARGEDLSRVIDQVAGARVLDVGGPVGQTQLTLRGGAPTQALIIVDGIPLRTPFARGFDLGLIHPETLRSVELVRGGQGASWGDGALTGALVLSTRSTREAPLGAMTLVLGSFGTTRLSAVALAPGLSVSGSYERTEGDFDYVSQLVGLPDVDRVRANNDSQRASVSASGRYALAGGQLDLLGAFAVREAGVPGLADSPGESLVARERIRHLRAQGGWSKDVAWAEGGALRLVGHLTQLDLAYRDPALNVVSDVVFNSTGLDGELTLGIAEVHLLRAVLSGSREWVPGPDYPGRTRLSGALSDEWSLGPALVFGALRLEGVQGQRLALLPRVGLRWPLGEALALSLAVGRSLRTPTLDELYHPEEVAYAGNPDLVSERSWEGEVQVSLQGGAWSGKVAGFARRIDDAILYLNRNAFLVRPENVGAARALGLELEWQGQLQLGPVRAELMSQLSLLASQLEATKARLPTQPVWNLAVQGVLGWSEVELDTALRAVGPTFVNLRPSDDNRVPAYLRWDAGLRVNLVRQVVLGFEVLNLLDRRTLASVNRFPLPGRTVLLSLRLASSPAD